MCRNPGLLRRVIFFFFLSLSPSAALSPDGLALLALKFAVEADPSSALAAWDESDDDPCFWPGVSCTHVPGFSYPRVIGVSVPGKNLTGYIPSELGSLSYLRRLNLHSNSLSGIIPPQLSEAKSLRALYLYSNNLSGPIPAFLCRSPRLQLIDISDNGLSGEIPAALGDCRHLRNLVLSGNRLSGEVPAEIWARLGGLVQLDLSRNNLKGPIPPDLGGLRSLSRVLNLSHNRFSGAIPSSLGNLPATAVLDLRGNNLSGKIPQKGILLTQEAIVFVDNPKLCGWPLHNLCKDPSAASPGSRSSPPLPHHVEKEVKERRKGLKVEQIVAIAVADAVGVAVIGAAAVYACCKLKETSRGCSCSRKVNLGGDGGRRTEPCCARCVWFSPPAAAPTDEEPEEEDDDEGRLVALDKGFSLELDELLRASAYVLGKGSLGIVYKVVLSNGEPVTVRRLGEGAAAAHQRKEFTAEARLIARVQHPNVVRLIAFYWSTEEKLLLSEFISNGSLAGALRGRAGQPAHLPWATRIKIARGTAQGLAHIHDCGNRKVVHGEINPSNVLLDADFNPYVADLGLRRLAHIAGISGASRSSHLAPEAHLPGSRPTQKWDVFSFGLVLLELLTGRSADLASPSRAAPPMDPTELVAWVKDCLEKQTPLMEMVDPALHRERETKKEEILSAFNVALACTDRIPGSRPKMKTVSELLQKLERC